MESRTFEPPPHHERSYALAWLGLLLVLLTQIFCVLHVFGGIANGYRVWTDQPILCGKHPLHTYHGLIGSESWRRSGSGSCYDPTFQAGYAKTPIFDSGSRPAELACRLLPGQPFRAYRLGLYLLAVGVPLYFFLAGHAFGMGIVPTVLCALCGTVLCWSPAGAAAWQDGDLDIMWGGYLVLLHIAGVVRFGQAPGVFVWFLLTVSAALAWSLQPMVLVLCAPALVIHVLWYAGRHDFFWHIALLCNWFAAWGINASWLLEWSRSLTLLLPAMEDSLRTPDVQSFLAGWEQALPHEPLSIAGLCLGALGLMRWCIIKPQAGSLSLAVLLTVLFAVRAERLWPILEDLKIARFSLLIPWLLVCPAVDLLAWLFRFLQRGLGRGFTIIACLAVIAAGSVWLVERDLPTMVREPGALADGESQFHDLAAFLKAAPLRGRVLVEETPLERQSSSLALLPLVTGRSFLGGLDPDSRLEHFLLRLSPQRLNGRPIAEWKPEALAEFFTQYNITEILAFTEETQRWVRATPGVRESRQGNASLFALPRESSYFLRGKGKWVEANWQRIALADVEPEDGVIVLALHYQQHMTLTPNVGIVERHLVPDDPIPLTRIRLTGPTSRLTLEWRSRD
jgi:hypothetical protein